MKKNTLLLAVLSVAPGIGHTAEPVYSDPVGFVKLGNASPTPGNPDAVPADTDITFSLPLEREIQFTGTVASTAADEITVQGSPAWTANQWVPASGAPYVAVIGSGAENGLRGLITGNTVDTLTLDLSTPGNLLNVSVGDSVAIRQAWTVASVFADAQIPNNCELVVFDQTKDGINHSGSAKYLVYEGVWYDAGDFSISDDIVLHPGERFRFRSKETPIPTLTLFGDVPLAANRVDITKDGPANDEDMEIDSGLPIPTLVGDLTIPAENNDELLIFDNVSSGINKAPSQAGKLIFYNGLWYDAVTFADVTTSFIIEPGQGFVFRRDEGSSTSAEWVQPSP